MTARRGILAAVVALSALVLTACGGFATSGPVEYGNARGTTADESQNFVFLPNLPQPGASPAEIVEGFINAGTGPGADGKWSVAREFLAPGFRGEWDPEASVTVDIAADRTYSESEGGAVDFSYDAVATVDDRGAYERAELAERSLPFTLRQQSDGEWRITDAPDGVVVDRDQFPRVFHRYPIMYFDPTWDYLVPDVRWFPTGNAETRISRALVNQPRSEWLVESVVTAFPDGVTAQLVLNDGGVAQVELTEDAAAAGRETLDRMLTQLEASLAAAGVLDVEMRTATTPLTAQPVETRSTRLPASPLVYTEAGFGFLVGEELEPIPGLTAQVVELEQAPAAIQVAPDRDIAGVRLAGGEVVRVYADGTDMEPLDDRPGLVDPTVDPEGNVWSAPREEPAALRVYLRSGEMREIEDAWPGATAISAMALSRDGTRLTATVTAGGRTMLWVAGVVRDSDGLPIALGTPLQLAIVGAPASAVTWIDDATIGVLAGDASGWTVLEQTVGGPSASTTAPADSSSIAGGNGLSSLRLRAADGTLYVKRGVTWQPTMTGVLVLATQQGAPQ
ncbi:LpqB family beta-propeller domain-containing protein [Microbacterium cremeum]|uniref:LpqB family beta-propeller domain-containing protein n=1 Tax=Microbacterium cremeum TaxID=2782169 RepID=UPI0018871841|nr:LpqB family beta-propeller domain-containing protein [Microbacterium cremeum]